MVFTRNSLPIGELTYLLFLTTAKIRAKLTDALQQFVDAIPKFPPSAQELTVKILSKCMLKGFFGFLCDSFSFTYFCERKEDNSVNNTPVAVVLIPLLEATQEPLKLVVTDLLSKLSKHGFYFCFPFS